MKIRAILFDLYKTILEVTAPPDTAEALWQQMGQEQFSAAPTLTLAAFAAACENIIAREHAAARAIGLAYPEIYWPTVAKEAMPELDKLTPADLEEFLFLHAQLQRSVRLMPGALPVLKLLIERGVPLGLASNCQPYTIFELATALDATGLTLTSFQPDLCFLSYKHGFSKPDPHVFRLLTARLLARDILSAETLMVGDRPDNDIEAAKPHGFQTWLLTGKPGGGKIDGDWKQLGNFLSGKN